MVNTERGFTLLELVTVMILVGVLSVSLLPRLGSFTSANVQAGRDDLITALSFAQQTAMARSGIKLIVTSSTINVTENGTSIVFPSVAYPLSFPTGVTATPATFTYDKLGKTSAATITLSNTSSNSATVKVEASGYAY